MCSLETINTAPIIWSIGDYANEVVSVDYKAVSSNFRISIKDHSPPEAVPRYTLEIKNVSESDAGRYKCYAGTPRGNPITRIQLEIVPPEETVLNV